MEARMKSSGNPGVMTAIQQLNKAMYAGGVDPLVLEPGPPAGQPDQRL
jgi:hypothetical protein